MDGHDNDENANNAGSAQGGIFSTPDLTVDAEKIAQPTQADERKRVASIFANTDTGRQAQKLNDAMEAQTTMPAAEDVVINNGGKKRGRRPITLLVVMSIVIVSVVGFIVWIVVRNASLSTSTTSKTAKEIFTEYVDLVKAGPVDIIGTLNDVEDGWFLFNLNMAGLVNSDYTDYIAKLRDNYSRLIEQNTHDELSEILVLHQRLLIILTTYYSLDRLNNELTNKYLQDGDTAAQIYINEVIPAASGQDDESVNTLSIASDLERNYLTAQLNILRRYRTSGCIIDDELDIGCAVSNSQIQQEEQSAAELRESLASLIPILENNFTKSMNAIQSNLEQI